MCYALFVDCWLFVVYCLISLGCWKLVDGYWSLVVCCWLLVVAWYWLLVSHYLVFEKVHLWTHCVYCQQWCLFWCHNAITVNICRALVAKRLVRDNTNWRLVSSSCNTLFCHPVTPEYRPKLAFEAGSGQTIRIKFFVFFLNITISGYR